MSVSRIEVMINAQKSEAALFAASYVIATTCEYIGTESLTSNIPNCYNTQK